ncbi:maestro heat-like repeat-containing protein family member 7 [Strix uralensis]|uniref:maestro heat-like repeat-containing protein family member 7 n=1 Tax=Strix uralensis TaxID=36305 RepID=UPI003DA56F37
MVKTVQSVLLPLFFYTSDQIESVAKASRDTLLACAEFLGWRRLSSMAKTCQTHLIGECLITHNRSRVKKYLCQSLPYLKDPQATVREEAVRFIGLAARSRRILSQERLWEICNALLPLRKDTELSVRSLAAETVSILTTEQRLISRWSLRSLFCWPW